MAEVIETESNLLPNDGFVMVSAPWCGPCKVILANLEMLPMVKLWKINTDTDTDYAQKMEVRSIPTILKMENGNCVDRIVGANLKELAKFLS